MEVITILDTALATATPTQSISDEFLRADKPLRFSCDLGAGDTVQIQGRGDGAMAWDVLYTFSDEIPKDIYPSKYMRAVRTVDGGEDTKIYVHNPYQAEFVTLTAHL